MYIIGDGILLSWTGPCVPANKMHNTRPYAHRRLDSQIEPTFRLSI